MVAQTVKNPRKITVAEVMGGKAWAKEAPRDKPLMAVRGVASSAGIKTTTFGDSVMLVGPATAINLVTGQAFQSNVTYLPGYLADMVKAQLSQGGTVDYSFVLGITDDGKGGYTYFDKPLGQEAAQQSQAMLAELITQVGGLQLGLKAEGK